MQLHLAVYNSMFDKSLKSYSNSNRIICKTQKFKFTFTQSAYIYTASSSMKLTPGQFYVIRLNVNIVFKYRQLV